jgi:site-specific DNA recombinase
MEEYPFESIKTDEADAFIDALYPSNIDPHQFDQPTIRAAIYSRRSVTDDDDVSTRRQVSRALAHCRRNNFSIVIESDIFIDRNRSGATRSGREGLAAMLKAASEGRFDVLVIDQVDRISRRIVDALAIVEELEAAGVELHTSGSGRVSEFELGVRSLQGQRERTILAELMQGGQRRAAEDGRFIGSWHRFGYRRVSDGRGLEINPEEAEVIRRCFLDLARGVGPTELARRLNAEHVRGPRGGLWNVSSFRMSNGQGLLQRPILKGRYVWDRFSEEPVEIERPDLAIVPADLFDAVSAMPKGSPRTRSQLRPERIFKNVRCVCGAAMRVVNSRPKSGFYQCHAARMSDACGNSDPLQVADVERETLMFIRDDLLDPDRLSFWDEIRTSDWRRRQDATNLRRSQISARMQEIDDAIRQLEVDPGACVSYRAEQLGFLEYEYHAAARSRAELEFAPPTPLGCSNAERLRNEVRCFLAELPRLLRSEEDLRIAARLRELLPCVVVQAGGTGHSLRFLVGVPGCPEKGMAGCDASDDRWVVRPVPDRVKGRMRFPEVVLRHHAAAEAGAFKPSDAEWRRIRHLFQPCATRCDDLRLAAEALIFLATSGLPVSMVPERYQDVAFLWVEKPPPGMWIALIALSGSRRASLETPANAHRFGTRASTQRKPR